MAPQEQQPAPGAETYAGDDRAEREATADSAGGGGFLGELHRAIAGVRADQAADVYADGQARRLESGMRTRGGPDLPGTDYLGYEHPAMKQMVETNMDPGQVNETGAGWNALGNALVEFQSAVAAAVGRSNDDWSGAGGNAARTYLSGLGDWMGDTGQASQLAANRMNAQSEAAATAKSAMPEPVDFSMNDAIAMLEKEKNPLSLPNTINQINQRFAEKQQAHERAAEVMTTFAASMDDSGSGMPEFAPVPAMGPATGGASPGPVDRGPVVEWPGGGGFRPSDGGGPPDSSPPGIAEWGGGPTGSAPPVADGPRAPGSDPGRTPLQSWEPGSPMGGPTGGDRLGVRPPAVGPLPAESVGALPIGGGFSSGGPGSAGGTRRPEPGGGRGSGPGGRPGAGGEPGAGARSPGGSAAERAMGRDAGAGRGAGGAGLGPMGAGGRGAGHEDREHTRPSWLEEPDPEGVFGTDELTAPPVIGLDED